MKEQLIQVNTEKLAYEKGYYYSPTQSLLQRWLRENHNISIVIDSNHSGWYWTLNKVNGTRIKEYNIDYHDPKAEEDSGYFKSYEDALESALQEALKTI